MARREIASLDQCYVDLSGVDLSHRTGGSINLEVPLCPEKLPLKKENVFLLINIIENCEQEESSRLGKHLLSKSSSSPKD